LFEVSLWTWPKEVRLFAFDSDRKAFLFRPASKDHVRSCNRGLAVRKTHLFCLAILMSASVLCSSSLAQRSLVGKRLSGETFVDTEGHVIDPAHYKGSVLVMYSGIPW